MIRCMREREIICEREREIIYMREREREGDPMREGGTHGRQADRQTGR